jgi:ABC-type nitrate/sulfonate/bicarbonate transport system permease component
VSAKPELLIRAGVVIAVLVLWEVCARAFVDPAIFAPPSRVAAVWWATLVADPKVGHALVVALLEIVVAFVLAVVVGISVGVAIGITNLGRLTLFPFVLLLWGLPQVVFLPLVILIFGIGPPSRIAFGFSHAVLPVIVNTVAGMRDVNPLYLASARASGASQAQVLRHVIFPNMVATVFTGLRLAMTMTLLGVILAELFVSTNGIGAYTQLFADTFKPAPLLALVLTLALIAVVLNELVRLIELRFTRWRQG